MTVNLKERLKSTSFYQNIVKDSPVHKIYLFFVEFPIIFKVWWRKNSDLLCSLKKLSLFRLHLKFRKILKRQKKEWPHWIYTWGYFYQGYDRIGISGSRPTERRFKLYELEPLLKPHMRALDIGSNAGFFAIEISYHVNTVDAIDWNPYMNEAARETAAYLGRTNVNVMQDSFDNLKPDAIYDVIISLASHLTHDEGMKTELKEYLSKICSMLKNNGVLLFETHPDQDRQKCEDYIENHDSLFIIEKKKLIADTNLGDERLYYQLRKKQA